MNWVTKPKVILVSQSTVSSESGFKDYCRSWVPTGNHLDVIPEFAGRVCYQSFDNRRPGGNEAYIQHILGLAHGSVLEHSVVTYLITGVSRSLTHELIRHRAGTGFSELSQRYYDFSDEQIGFVLPPQFEGSNHLSDKFKKMVDDCFKLYRQTTVEMISDLSQKWQFLHPGEKPSTSILTAIRKKARQAARAILPNCTETHIVVTGNLRAWRNILEQRGSLHADLEFRRLALALAADLKLRAPSVFSDVQPFMDEDGYTSLAFDYRKV